MTLVDAMRTAEAVLERPLAEDEIVLLGRFVEANDDQTELLRLLESDVFFRPPELSDDEVPIHRYEPSGEETAREI